MLQAPMPLPLLAKPVDVTTEGRVNYNTEPPSPGIEGDAPRNGAGDKVPAPADYSHCSQFTYEDRKGNHWVYRGLHAGPRRWKLELMTAHLLSASGEGQGW